MPNNALLGSIAAGVPCEKFTVKKINGRDAPVAQALNGQSGKLCFGDVEPGTVLGGVMDFEALRQTERFLRREIVVKRMYAMRV